MKLSLTLPDDLYDTYEAAASAAGVSLNTYLKDRLQATTSLTYRPLFLTPDERRDIEVLADIPIGSGRQLVDLVRRCLTLDLGSADMHLSADQLGWLEQIADGNGMTLSDYMEQQVPEFVDWLAGRG